MTGTIKTPHEFHSFSARKRKLPVLKNRYIFLDETVGVSRLVKLTEKTRNKAGLGVIYGEKEKYLLKNFLEEIIKIELVNYDKHIFPEIPDTILFKIIEKHTTEDFNPRNFLSNGYNNSGNGKASTHGGFLFFGEHNIKNAQAFLDLLNKN